LLKFKLNLNSVNALRCITGPQPLEHLWHLSDLAAPHVRQLCAATCLGRPEGVSNKLTQSWWPATRVE